VPFQQPQQRVLETPAAQPSKLVPTQSSTFIQNQNKKYLFCFSSGKLREATEVPRFFLHKPTISNFIVALQMFAGFPKGAN